MKKATVIINLLLIIGLLLPTIALGENENKENENKDTVSVIFTNNLHSNLQQSRSNEKGGFARIKTAVDNIEEKYSESLLIDGGGFSMGTPYQTIFSKEASELNTMGSIGYDVTTLSSSEFYYGTRALAKMLNVASKNVGIETKEERTYNQETYTYDTKITKTRKMPAVVGTNIDWKETLSNKKYKAEGEILSKAFDNYGVEDYTIIEKNGIKIAILGVIGGEAIKNTPEDSASWIDAKERAKSIVEEIKQNKEADMIVALYQNDIVGESNNKEDALDFAKEVPDIDLMLVSNEGKALKAPITEGKTIIISSERDSQSIGHIILKKENEKYKVDNYESIGLDESIEKNSKIQEQVDNYKDKINENYFSRFNTAYNKLLGKSNFDIKKGNNIKGEESALGDLISDAYIEETKKAEGNKYEKVSLAIATGQSINGSINKGEVKVVDVYNTLPLGVGPDDLSGYPLVSMYLTGKEIKNLAEADVSVDTQDSMGSLYFSGMTYSYNKHRVFLNKAIDIKLDNGKEKIENKKLYRVVASLGFCQELSDLEYASDGFISLEPKDKSGKEIKDFNKYIIKKEGHELKEWKALSSYVASFPNNTIPEKYNGEQSRKVDKTSWNPYTLVKQPNNFGFILLAIILIPVVIIIGIIFYIRKRRHNRRGYSKSMFGSTKQKKQGGKPKFKGKKIKRRKNKY